MMRARESVEGRAGVLAATLRGGPVALGNHDRTSRFYKTLAMLMLCAVSSPAAEAGGPVISLNALSAVPYAVAFTQHEFALYDPLTLSPGGGRVAYVVVAPPAQRPQNARSLPSGTPVYDIGAKLYVARVTARGTAQVTPVCAQRGNQWEPSWSPDGRMLAFASDADGAPQLWVYTPKTRGCRRVSDAVLRTSVFGGYGAKWSPDERTLYVPLLPHFLSGGAAGRAGRASGGPATQPDTPLIFSSGGESGGIAAKKSKAGSAAKWMRDQYSSSLAAIRLRTGDVRIIVPADARPRPNTMELSPSGRWISYRSVAYPAQDIAVDYLADLVVVPAAGGTPEVVAKGLQSSEHVIDYSQVEAHWAPTKDRLIYLKGNSLWSVEVSARGPDAAKRLAAQLGELAPVVCYFTRDGRSVVVGTEPVGSGRDRVPRGLAIVPLDGRVPVRLALPDPRRWSFLDMVRASPDSLWQPDRHFVTVQLRNKTTGEEAFARLDIATGRAIMLDRGLHQIGLLEARGDERALVGTYQDVSTPPNVYRFAGNFSSKRRLSLIDPRLERVRAGSAEVLETRAPLYDGALADVRTTVLLPPGAKRGDRLPGIVMIYAGADLSTRASSFGGGMGNTVPNLIFTSRDFAVIMADVRLAPYGRASNPMHNMVDVLLPQIYNAAAAGYVDINRLAVSGQSYGGYSTASILSQTNLFRAGIAVDGVFDLGSFYGGLNAETGDSHWVRWAEKGQGRMGEPPWTDPLRYIDNSPYYHIDRIHTPLLIVTGMNDKVVPYTQSERLFVGLRRLGRSARLLMYPRQGHVIDDWSTSDAIDVSRRMVKFLRTHLGSPRGAAIGQ